MCCDRSLDECDGELIAVKNTYICVVVFPAQSTSLCVFNGCSGASLRDYRERLGGKNAAFCLDESLLPIAR